MGLLDSITKIATDVVDIAAAPVKIAVDTTRVITKPIADVANEVTKEVKEAVEDIIED